MRKNNKTADLYSSVVEELWRKQIQELKKYCQKKNWEVLFVKRIPGADTAIPGDKRIIIREDRNPEVAFYYFLHEIGHMFVAERNNRKSIAAETMFGTSSLTYKICYILENEEIPAWNSGFNLAKRLDLEVNMRNFNQIKANCLASYMKWSLKRRINKEIKKHDLLQQRTINDATKKR